MTEIHDTNGKLLAGTIPFDTVSRKNIAVYRYHDGAAEAMKENPGQGEEGFVVGDGSITIYASKFSDYAIGYTEQTQPRPSGGGGGVTTYTVTVKNTENGTVTSDKKTAAANAMVTLTVKPAEGYQLDRLTAADRNDNAVTLTKNDDGAYTFRMPASNVTVMPVFTAITSPEPVPEPAPADNTCPKDATCPISRFADAVATEWYHDGVHWALENGVMNGVGDDRFAPNDSATRAMVVTMLWRLEGEPEGGSEPFADVHSADWFSQAVRWAAENGVVKGVTETEFCPDMPVTREQLATILYRCAQARGLGFTGSWAFRMDFPDLDQVDEYAYEALCWMTMKGIINGMDDGTLDPQGNATRAQIATMFMRYCGEVGQ